MGCAWCRAEQLIWCTFPLQAPNAEAGSWSQSEFALAVPLLWMSTASDSSLATLLLSIELIPRDSSDTCFSPRKVLAHEAETAGVVMTFFLALGLSLGAGISFLFRMLI